MRKLLLGPLAAAFIFMVAGAHAQVAAGTFFAIEQDKDCGAANRACNVMMYTVPEGRSLLIQSVSCHFARGSVSQAEILIPAIQMGAMVRYNLPLMPQAAAATGDAIFAALALTYSAGQKISLEFLPAVQRTSVECAMSGQFSNATP